MKLLLSLVFLCFSFTNIFASNSKIIVSKDGTGDFKTIQEAVTACGAFSEYEKIVYIKNGLYNEKILIDSFHSNISIIGESSKGVRIINGDYVGKENIGTFTSYTFKVLGDHVRIENLTIENTSGPIGQAVALHVEGDYFIANKCMFIGCQDTLYASGKYSRQYFNDCFISGTTDFIFGASTAIFNNCEIHSKSNSFITAANTPKEIKFGYVFMNCRLTADEKITSVYLGRPWRSHAKVVFINCIMDKHIRPEGWHNWGKPEREESVYYAEYGSKGAGANLNSRVEWSYRLKENDLKKYNIENIFKLSSSWNPEEHYENNN